MREIVWRIGDPSGTREESPSDAAEARAALEAGNADFAALFDAEGDVQRIMQLAPSDLGVSETGEAPQQRPFATLISCADARVPVELLTNQQANDLFVVRVAGGVLSEGALGSLDFAVGNLPTVRLTVSLGHTRCGAVAAAVDTYLDPPAYLALGHSRPLLALVQNLLGSVRLADHALHEVHGAGVDQRGGYAAALNELSVVANAGANASAIAGRISRRAELADPVVTTVFGVYDLVSRQIGLPGSTTDWTPGLVDAPPDGPAFVRLLREVAFGPRLTRLLDEAQDEA
jgi:carbonic anhydrase